MQYTLQFKIVLQEKHGTGIHIYKYIENLKTLKSSNFHQDFHPCYYDIIGQDNLTIIDPLINNDKSIAVSALDL